MAGDTHKYISYIERQQEAETVSLKPKNSWAKTLIPAYNGMNLLKNSGREFSGSDPIVKNLESTTFSDPYNKFYVYEKIQSTYIYIISKRLDGKLFFKVGEGGGGDKTSGPGRLGDAQTFLIPGIGDSVGYRVHFLLFFRKGQSYPYGEKHMEINKKIELDVHKNLRHEFRSASIMYPSGKPSEWYIVPPSNELFFLGFVMDIIASFTIAPLAVWKLTLEGKLDIQLPTDWKTRMDKNPDYQRLYKNNTRKNKKQFIPVGTQITTIDYNDVEDAGSVKYFKEQLLPQPNKLFFVNRKEYTLIDIIRNLRSLQYDQPLEFGKIYGILECTVIDAESLEEKNITLFNVLDVDQQEVPIERIKTRAEAQRQLLRKEPIPTSKYYIFIGELLSLLRENLAIQEYEGWNLKTNYEYYENQKRGNNIVNVPSKDATIVPAWYFNIKAQAYWAQNFSTELQYKYHMDSSKLDAILVKWKVTGFFKSDNGMIEINRVQVMGDTHSEIPNTSETISIIHLMKLFKLNESQRPTKMLKSGKEVPLDPPNILTLPDKRKLKKGDIIQLKDDYFLFYDRFGIPENPSSHKGFTYYIVKKIYRRTYYSEDINPWFDIQEYPFIDKRIWCILSTDFIGENASKLVISAKTEKQIEKVKKMLDEKEDKETGRKRKGEEEEQEEKQEENEEENKDVRFKKNDIIRIIPAEDETLKKTFGEEVTDTSKYHYAVVMGSKNGLYEIKYFPPWDKKKAWGFSNETKVHREDHSVDLIDLYGKKVEQDDPELQTYKDSLLGIFTIETLYGHSPQNKRITDHSSFLLDAKRQGLDPIYKVHWKGYKKGEDSEQNAEDLYKDAKETVDEYWKPKPKTKTRKRVEPIANRTRSKSLSAKSILISKSKSKSKSKSLELEKTKRNPKPTKNMTRKQKKDVMNDIDVMKIPSLEILHSLNGSGYKVARKDIEKLFYTIKNQGDGNCLFESFSQLMPSDKNELRKKVCAFYKSLKSMKYFDEKEDLLVAAEENKHGELICNNKEWGTMDDAQIISRKYKCNVYIFAILKGDQKKPFVRLLIYRYPNSNQHYHLINYEGNHFEALIPR